MAFLKGRENFFKGKMQFAKEWLLALMDKIQDTTKSFKNSRKLKCNLQVKIIKNGNTYVK